MKNDNKPEWVKNLVREPYMAGELPQMYGMRVFPNSKCKLNVMEYKTKPSGEKECHVHPILYGSLRLIDAKNWEAFFRLANIKWRMVKTRI